MCFGLYKYTRFQVPSVPQTVLSEIKTTNLSKLHAKAEKNVKFVTVEVSEKFLVSEISFFFIKIENVVNKGPMSIFKRSYKLCPWTMFLGQQ